MSNAIADYAIFDGVPPSIRFGNNKLDFGIDCGCSIHANMTGGKNEILIDRRCAPYQLVLEDLIGFEEGDEPPECLDEAIVTEIAERHADSIVAWAIHQHICDIDNFVINDDEEAEGLIADIFNVPSVMLMIGSARHCSMFEEARIGLKADLAEAARAVGSANVVKIAAKKKR